MSTYIITDVNHKERLDKWLWMARFFKTRTLATDFIQSHTIMVNGSSAKPSKELKMGDKIVFQKNQLPYALEVLAFCSSRGNPSLASLMYAEDEIIFKQRINLIDSKKQMQEPARILKGRPTKKDRRQLNEWLEEF